MQSDNKGVLIVEIISRLTVILNRASHDFTFGNYHKSGCMTYYGFSYNLNQIIFLKYPLRKDYISPATARKYLQGSQKILEDVFGKKILESNKPFFLNIIISEKLTKSCIDMKGLSPVQRKMDMLFNPRFIKDEEIVCVICRALYKKINLWRESIERTFKKKGLKPYKEHNKKISLLKDAENVFFRESWNKVNGFS